MVGVVKFCKCGCGRKIIIKPYHKYYGTPDYISGHNVRGKPGWMRGLTKETDLRVAQATKNFAISRKGKPAWNSGLTKETDSRVAKIGEKVSENAKINPNSGTKGKTKEEYPQLAHSKKSRKKISKTMKKRGLGRKEKNGNWKGGTSFLPYSPSFDNELKSLIRLRDNFLCQLCGMSQEENIRKFEVHHINNNKENSIPSNLISLCKSCHSRVSKNAGQYEKHFANRIKENMEYERNQIKERVKNAQKNDETK